MAPKAERIAHRDIDLRPASFKRHKIHLEIAFLIRIFQVYRGRDDRFVNNLYTYYNLYRTCGAEQMPEAAFSRADRCFICVLAKNSFDGCTFSDVVQFSTSPVRVYIVIFSGARPASASAIFIVVAAPSPSGSGAVM